jgi:predicted nucleic acid-binding protein
MKEDVKTAAEFWRGWAKLMEDERFLRVDEPPALEDAWRTVTSALRRGHVAGTDAYLAAFAAAGKHRIVSFDQGMNRFAGVDAEILN